MQIFNKRVIQTNLLRPSENSALLILSISVGLASGAGIWAFRVGIDLFHKLFVNRLADGLLHPLIGSLGIVVALALAGLVVGWIMDRFIGEERHHGVAGIMEAVALGGGWLRYQRMPFKALASALSLGAGASVGPEDPSVQIGANLGSFLGQRLHLSEERIRLLVAAGAASAIAAAFNAPIAGVFFALEVILNGEFSTSSFGVVVLAGVVSSVFTQAIETGEPEMGILNYTLGNPLEMPFYALLGLLLGPVAALFIRAVYWQHDFWHQHIHFPHPLKTAFAGVLVGIVGIFLPEIMGTGRHTMNLVLNGRDDFSLGLLLALGAAKLLMTTTSMAGGFVGGIFAPSLFIGIMLGGAYGRVVIDIGPVSITGNAQAYAIAGMAAIMAGVVRAPITAILLVFEMTNDYRLILPIMLTTVVCVYVTERFEPSGIYILGLLRKGIRLQQGHDVDLMQSVTVGEAMISPAPTIPGTASLRDLRDQLRQHSTRAICVIADDGLLHGIVTLTDLQRAYESSDSSSKTVHDISTYDVITVTPDEALWQAIRKMGTRDDIGHLPVVRSGTRELIGMLNRHDIVRAYHMAILRKREGQHQAEQVRLNLLTGAHVFEMQVEHGARGEGKQIHELSWPHESIIASIRRDGRVIVPHGETRLHAGDQLTLVANPQVEPELSEMLTRPAPDTWTA